MGRAAKMSVQKEVSEALASAAKKGGGDILLIA